MKPRLIALLMLGALALPTAAPATPPAITLEMQKDEKGVWTVTTDALEPDMYG